MTTAKLSEIVGSVVELLSPLSPDDRRRVIGACEALLGDNIVRGSSGSPPIEKPSQPVHLGKGSAKTSHWQKQSGLTDDQLKQVFHDTDGRIDVIAAGIPGKTKKEQTLNAYVLTGIGKLLATGEARFDDKDARALCVSSGCYDSKHHADTLKDKGNWMAGSKELGWTLTAPGLKHGAELVKLLSDNQG